MAPAGKPRSWSIRKLLGFKNWRAARRIPSYRPQLVASLASLARGKQPQTPQERLSHRLIAFRFRVPSALNRRARAAASSPTRCRRR